MIAILITLLSFLFTDTIPTPTTIRSVTVFREQAQISREADVSLKKGENTLLFSGLSLSVDPSSARLRASGPFSILSLTDIDMDAINTQNPEIKRIDDEIATLKSRERLTTNAIELLQQTQQQITTQKMSPTEIGQLIDFYRGRAAALDKELTDIKASISELIRKKVALFDDGESGIGIVARIHSPHDQRVRIELTYLTEDAGWNPVYEARFAETSDSLQLSMKADVYQHTDEDWTNVKLTLNTGNPTNAMEAPVLTPHRLGEMRPIPRASTSPASESRLTVRPTRDPGVVTGQVSDRRTSEALPGATVLIRELRIGAAADQNGRFTIRDVPDGRYTIQVTYVGYRVALGTLNLSNSGANVVAMMEMENLSGQEVVVTGYGTTNERALTGRVERISFAESTVSTVIEEVRTTSLDYAIEAPYSIPSDGSSTFVDIRNMTPHVEFHYEAVPLLTSRAFLSASIRDWDELNLLEGDLLVYSGNRLMGRTVLNPRIVEDSLSISMGYDDRVVVSRNTVRQQRNRTLLGTRVRESRAWDIQIRNTRSEPITIKVQDQVPLSADSRIKVDGIELNGGVMDPETGIVTWTLTLNPNETAKRVLRYRVEYPKGMRIGL